MTTPQPGDRVRLIAMPNDPDPISPGTTGTVKAVRKCDSCRAAWLQVDVEWDNGRKLMLSVPPDEFEVMAGAAEE